MSRLKNYINEKIKKTPYTNGIEEDVDNVISTIKNNCKPFLKEWNPRSGFLYRGVKMHINDIEMRTRRKNRRTRDSAEYISEGIDVEFQKKFGWKPRKEGVFTTGDKLATSIYGTTYLFFPIRKYRYVWSPKINDLYTMTTEIYDFSIGDEEEEDKYVKKWSEQIVKSYTDKKLTHAMVIGKGEIVFDVNNYFIVDVKFEDAIYREFK